MIVSVNIQNDFKINKLSDLTKLNMEGIKLNKSEIARSLDVSRTTVSKYLAGFKPKTTRNKGSKLDVYYNDVEALLYPEGNTKRKLFHYKRNLYQYCIENNIICDVTENTFKHWLRKYPNLNEYFKSSISKRAEIRYETALGEQAQVDWKENLKIVLKDGQEIEVNILVVILSHSRYRYYALTFSKTQDVLLHHLDKAFECFGGVPRTLLTDNMKTVMDEARTNYSEGKINNRFSEFAKDYQFVVHACVSGRAKTKGKVEQPMRILDYLQVYNNDLTLEELVNKVNEINERENSRYHNSYNKVPLMALQKEKDFLLPLPKGNIRSQYQVATTQVTVDKSSLISYKSNKYSVPPKYLNKKLTLQVFDNKLHLYYTTQLVTVHDLSSNKGEIFYHKEDYKNILIDSKLFKIDDIDKIAENNLSKLGGKKND